MKLSVAKREIETDGFSNDDQRSFGIKSSGMMFKILSDKLYSDKIAAVVREYGCNAYDAHVIANNQDKPFEVHLPNQFEPYFHIRDYGPGLTEQEIYEIYTQYGVSTKSDRNDQVGALGLGSKSAFAYSDQFTIESYFNGELKTYQAYMDEVGEPKVVKLSEEQTNQPNGVKIFVMVENSDFRAFAERAAKVFSRFPVLPTITGNSSFEMHKVEHLLEADGFRIRKPTSHFDRQSYAVQGTVAYPLRSQAMSMVTMTSLQRNIIDNLSIDIDFPIGDLDIAPSREELSYDKRTQENILRAIDKIIQKVPSIVNNAISTAATLWEAKTIFNEWFLHESDTVRTLVRSTNQSKTFVWQGKSYKNEPFELSLFDFDKVTTLIPDYVSKNRGRLTSAYTIGAVEAIRAELASVTNNQVSTGLSTMPIVSYTRHQIRSIANGYRQGRSPNIAVLVPVLPSRKGDTLVVIPDDKKRMRSMSRFIGHNVDKDKHEHVIVLPVTTKLEAKPFLDQLGGFPDDQVVLLSEWDEPPAIMKTVAAAPVAKRRGYKVSFYGSNSQNDYMNFGDEVELNTDSGLYCVRYRGVMTKQDDMFGDATDGELNRLLQIGAKLGVLSNDDNIVAFNQSRAASIKDDANWQPVWPVVLERMNKLFADQKLITILDRHRHLWHKCMVYRAVAYNLPGIEKMLDNAAGVLLKRNSKFVKVIRQYIETIKFVKNSEGYKSTVAKYKERHGDPTSWKEPAWIEYNPNVEQLSDIMSASFGAAFKNKVKLKPIDPTFGQFISQNNDSGSQNNLLFEVVKDWVDSNMTYQYNSKDTTKRLAKALSLIGLVESTSKKVNDKLDVFLAKL